MVVCSRVCKRQVFDHLPQEGKVREDVGKVGELRHAPAFMLWRKVIRGATWLCSSLKGPTSPQNTVLLGGFATPFPPDSGHV